MPVRFQVDPDFYDHPKAIGLSDAATALWVRAGSYSAAKLTDGFIAEPVLALLSRSPQEASGELIARGLWRRVKGGFRFHQWEQRNLSRSRVEAERDADKQRKRAQRLAAKQTEAEVIHRPKPRGQKQNPQADTEIVPPDSGPDSGGNPDGVRGLSVSVSVSESVSGSGRGEHPGTQPAAASGPRPEATCRQHRDDPDPPACGRCKEARQAVERWDAGEADRRRNAPQCRIHRGQPAHNCGPCRADALVGDGP